MAKPHARPRFPDEEAGGARAAKPPNPASSPPPPPPPPAPPPPRPGRRDGGRRDVEAPPRGFGWIELAIMSNVFLYGFDGTVTAATYVVIGSEFGAANTSTRLLSLRRRF
ncbi:uncharacterized protein LY79DRAFT_671438 [Colletotrichum navitas]|uniref:Uncharacterized protein n=1 Tax=Colletotrichum navitas TaxID=681940 RepID=A0AAD8PVJ6_9PEZI|nr:uncharacterized protein LY79DRAFT_671438 [Colletotrichum navitas]KAK1584835.1 hypothetical protein LY79DRAFT_671438 [Colletotrichum navitas]